MKRFITTTVASQQPHKPSNKFTRNFLLTSSALVASAVYFYPDKVEEFVEPVRLRFVTSRDRIAPVTDVARLNEPPADAPRPVVVEDLQKPSAPESRPPPADDEVEVVAPAPQADTQQQPLQQQPQEEAVVMLVTDQEGQVAADEATAAEFAEETATKSSAASEETTRLKQEISALQAQLEEFRNLAESEISIKETEISKLKSDIDKTKHSVVAVEEVIGNFYSNAQLSLDAALEAISLLHPRRPTPGLLDEKRNLEISFLGDETPSFSKLLFAKILAQLFSLDALETTNGIPDEQKSTSVAKNVDALFRARQAAKRSLWDEASEILRNDTHGNLKNEISDWVAQAQSCAEEQIARDLAKAAVYARISELLTR